jgi:hypothetical protein
MEKQRIMRPRPAHEPPHRIEHVLPRRQPARVRGVVREDDDVFGLVIGAA